MSEGMGSNTPDDPSRRGFFRKAGAMAAGASAAMMGVQSEVLAGSPKEEMEQFVAFREKFNVLFQDFKDKARDTSGLSDEQRGFVEEMLGDSSRIKLYLEIINGADVKKLDAAKRYTWSLKDASIVIYFVARIAKWDDIATQFDELRKDIDNSLGN